MCLVLSNFHSVVIKNLSFLLLSFAIFSCSNGKKTKPIIIKSPAWTREYNNKNNFSAIGITTKEGNLKEKIKYAEKNGIQNLKTNLGVELENFLLQEMACFEKDRRNLIVSTLLSDINNNIRLRKLEDITRREDVWKNPNNNSLYVLMVAAKGLVANTIISALESIKSKYRIYPEVQQIIIDAKYDIFANKFKARKRVCNNNKEEQNLNKAEKYIEQKTSNLEEKKDDSCKQDNMKEEKNKTLRVDGTNNNKQTDGVNIKNVIISSKIEGNNKEEEAENIQSKDAIEDQIKLMKNKYSDEEITKIVEEAIKLADLQIDDRQEEY